MPNLSIVVPVYNIEAYLPQCLDSILGQRFRNFEVLLIDDGSTDTSGAICNEYAKKDKRISVIHKRNGGVSSARNQGIKAATGDYIWFVDGDDTVPEDCFQKVLPFILERKPDISVCGINLSTDQLKTLTPLEYTFTQGIDQSHNYLEVMSDLYQNKDGMWSVSRNIYRRAFLEETGILFDTGLRCCEDCEFHMNIFQRAKDFFLTREAILNYRMNREHSLSTERDKVFAQNTISVFVKWIAFFSGLPDQEHAMSVVRRLANKFYAEILDAFCLENKQDRKEIFSLIWENRFAFRFINGNKRKIFSLVYRVFGLHFGRLIYLATHSRNYQKTNGVQYEIAD